MHRFVCLALLATAGCSGRLYTVAVTPSTATPDLAYACVQEKLKELDYGRVRYDATERWIVSRRFDYSVKVSSGSFRRAFDLLDVRLHPDSTGATELEIQAHTYHQYELSRGQTDEEVSASNRVKADAAAVAEACAR